MIISISIHYDAETECTITHALQLKNLHATVAMATIHDCASNGPESFSLTLSLLVILMAITCKYIIMEGNYALLN